MHTSTNPSIHTYIQTDIHTDSQTHTYIHTDNHILAGIHTYIHTGRQTDTQTAMQTQTHTGRGQTGRLTD